MPSPEQIANGSLEELRSMVTGVISECRQARTEIAHHKFQYKMLQDEYCQAKDRMNLEMFFMQKDVEVKSRKEEPAGQLATPALSSNGRAMSPGRQLVLDLRNTCQIFELENDELRHRLHDAKAVLLEREDSMVEENERLRERIRQNRKHVNLFRSVQLTTESPVSSFATPFVTPARKNHRVADHSRAGGDRFDALLLADQVLNREAANSAPSTPHAKHAIPQRNHAAPGSPHTPRQTAFKSLGPYYVHPAKQGSMYATPVKADPTPIRHHQGRRRRESRDSTISASDLEDEHEEVDVAPVRQATAKQQPVTPRMSERAMTVSQSAKRKAYEESPTRGRGGKRTRMNLGEGIGLGIQLG
jgi:hypothetical protein